MKGIIIQFFIYAFDNTNLHLLIVQVTQLFITKFNMTLNIIFKYNICTLDIYLENLVKM